MARDLRKAAARRLGQRIADKYHLRDVLGVGGMGVVYKAWHQFTERLVALKLLHPSIAAAHTHSQRFLQEATASGAIQHPGIAEVLDAGREPDGTLYVAFELLDGEDLGAAIVADRVPAERMIRVCIEVLAALDAAHAEGFIHRDIKPANIFLLDAERPTGRVKLLDFGIARRVRASGVSDGLTEAGAVVGTPYYMSPEQMCGEAVDGRADLWALAVVLFYGLTRELPFQGRSYVALLTEMLRGGPPTIPSRPEIPPGTASFIKRALAPRIEDRFQSASSMLDALRALVPEAVAADKTERIVPERTLRMSRRTGPPPRSRPSTTSGAPPAATEADPKWQRALQDIEGEIERLEAQHPTVAKPPARSATRKESWFGRKD